MRSDNHDQSKQAASAENDSANLPQPLTNVANKSNSDIPQPRVISSTYFLEDEAISKSYKKAIVWAAVVVVMIGIATIIIVSSGLTRIDATKAKPSSTTNTSVPNIEGQPTSGGTTDDTSQNPADGNASIGAEGQYCTNPLNALTSC